MTSTTTGYSSNASAGRIITYTTFCDTFSSFRNYIEVIVPEGSIYYNGKIFANKKALEMYKNKMKGLAVIKMLSRFEVLIEDKFEMIKNLITYKFLSPSTYWQKRRNRLTTNKICFWR